MFADSIILQPFNSLLFLISVCKCGCHSRLVIGSHIAADIRRQLVEGLGITSCAGIAHNKVLAKMAGEVHKPNQQTLMFPCHTEELLMHRNFVKKIPSKATPFYLLDYVTGRSEKLRFE